MPDPVTAIAGGSIASGLIGGIGSQKAASTQASAARDAGQYQLQAAREANALRERMYEETVERQEPFRRAGVSALSQLRGMTTPRRPTGFEESPGYQFALEEGLQAADRGAAARGLRMSGSALQDRMRFATGLANQDYGNWWNRETGLDTNRFNRTASLAGVGQTANQALGQAGQAYAGGAASTLGNAASGYGNALMQAGQARASGYQGIAGAANSALGGIGQGLGYAQSGAFGPNPGFGIQPSPGGLRAWGYA